MDTVSYIFVIQKGVCFNLSYIAGTYIGKSTAQLLLYGITQWILPRQLHFYSVNNSLFVANRVGCSLICRKIRNFVSWKVAVSVQICYFSAH